MSKRVIRERIDKLRVRMRREGVAAYLIMSEDFHGSEYVGDYFKCREYMSGFDGSAGTLVVTEDEAGLWTDGRYFLQADSQLQDTGIRLFRMGTEGEPTVAEYLKNVLKDGDCLAFDGRTVRTGYLNKIEKELAETKIDYRQNVDFVGDMWEDRPSLPEKPAWLLADAYTGESRGEKLERLRAEMESVGADYHLLATLDDINWLYNIRGNDIAYNPVALCYTLIDRSGENTILYISEASATDEVRDALSKDGVKILSYLQIYEDVKRLGAVKLLLHKKSVNVSLLTSVSDETEIIDKPNPTTQWKAIKNPTETENERLAHVRDGVAVTKLIYWLKQQRRDGELPPKAVTEMDVSKRLTMLRREQEGYIEESFAPIIATGAHGAIVHYEATAETNRPIEDNTFLLMDTGGHYYQGTTDITRTVAIGNLTHEQKRHYTAVLCGNLNLSAAHFKHGCTGANLDSLARGPLWELGLDYNHGTGHGVGYLLNVHEGPNAIRLKDEGGSVGAPLLAGMITSDEPGIYLENQYGIRLENLLLCIDTEKTPMGQFRGFEILTLVPFDRDAILPEVLSERQRKLLDDYHAKVYEALAPYLTEDERHWLYEVTRPI